MHCDHCYYRIHQEELEAIFKEIGEANDEVYDKDEYEDKVASSSAPRRHELQNDKLAQQQYKDLEASVGNFYKLEHCWDMLKDRENWTLIDKESPSKRGSLTNMDEDEDDDGPRNLNKPDGDKKTKEKIKREHEASSLRDKIDGML
ncbi:Lactation elevated protein 1 [Hordeum vulgare]|nr:Lactation elevated protein 1 [Hordeum vulgare]